MDDAAEFGGLILRDCAHEDRGAAGSEYGNLRLDRGHTITLSL